MSVSTNAWLILLIVENLAAQPDASVPQASGDWATTKATYRFWDNAQVQPEDIIAAHEQRTSARLKQHSVILAIQDTTGLSFNHHPSKTVEQGFTPFSAAWNLLTVACAYRILGSEVQWNGKQG